MSSGFGGGWGAADLEQRGGGFLQDLQGNVLHTHGDVMGSSEYCTACTQRNTQNNNDRPTIHYHWMCTTPPLPLPTSTAAGRTAV